MKKPLIGSLRSALSTRRDSRVAKRRLGDAVAVPLARAAARDEARADHQVERRVAPAARRASRGSSVSSCCRSPSITATTGAAVAHIPSMHADDSPRRPIRWITRTRGSSRAELARGIGGAVGAVVVDEDRFPAAPRQRRVELARPASATLPRSLKVGMTTASSSSARVTSAREHRVAHRARSTASPPRSAVRAPLGDRRRHRRLDPRPRPRPAPANGAASSPPTGSPRTDWPCPARRCRAREPWIGSYSPLPRRIERGRRQHPDRARRTSTPGRTGCRRTDCR